MSTYEWLLVVHVFSAAGVVAALVVLAAVVLGAGRGDGSADAALAALARPTSTIFSVAGLAVLVFGIWLAFEADYGLDEPWILAAILLWVVAAGTGERAGRPKARTRETDAPDPGASVTGTEPASGRPDRRARLLLALASASVLAMLALMIFKPGTG